MLQEVASVGREDVPLVPRKEQQERRLRNTYTPAAAYAVSRILGFSTPVSLNIFIYVYTSFVIMHMIVTTIIIIIVSYCR